jgi:hypothetical protein
MKTLLIGLTLAIGMVLATQAFAAEVADCPRTSSGRTDTMSAASWKTISSGSDSASPLATLIATSSRSSGDFFDYRP